LLVAVLTAAAVYAVLGGLDKNVTKRLPVAAPRSCASPS